MGESPPYSYLEMLSSRHEFEKRIGSRLYEVSYLRKQAKEKIRRLIEDRLPLEFEKSLLS